MRIITIILLCFPFLTGYGQAIPELNPVVDTLDLSVQGERAFLAQQAKCEKVWQKLRKGLEVEDLSAADQEILNTCSEVETSYWDVIDGGCSWYCGGGPSEVTASSFLEGQEGNSYLPENAHDLDYQTVWAEGAEGDGVGEYLLYTFAPQSPRITTIKVVNGYARSEKAWERNARIKKLKMYLGDQPMAILNLEDQRAVQSFTVGKLGYSDRDDFAKLSALPNWTLKFEIMEVYPGTKYKDAVITEIFFDGLDVHCFAAGTQISMADGSLKPIEKLEKGDQVLATSPNQSSPFPARILELAQVRHHHLVRITCSDGSVLDCTADHPFLLEEGTWASCQPEKTRKDYQYDQVAKLQVGSLLKTLRMEQGVRISDIQQLSGEQDTYTIVKLDRGTAFLANGHWVGLEALREIQKDSLLGEE